MERRNGRAAKALLNTGAAVLAMAAAVPQAGAQEKVSGGFELHSLCGDCFAIKTQSGRVSFTLSYWVDTSKGPKQTASQRVATERMEEFACGGDCQVIIQGVPYNVTPGQRYLVRGDQTLVVLKAK
ncbi:hypothetical protein QRD43_07680 [Pelomonas sp. APW6]|uniref:Uncharacterized protein n=1 Tax=Roseateles subflavus TaxID=3053353 RepID=A0ABT7LG02_9BURK|nr:hypothetical protein [Pelomonas sp. APW6]MDL5031786.1 hypothetical protein [Pelomonas sp. APW6]